MVHGRFFSFVCIIVNRKMLLLWKLYIFGRLLFSCEPEAIRLIVRSILHELLLSPDSPPASKAHSNWHLPRPNATYVPQKILPAGIFALSGPPAQPIIATCCCHALKVAHGEFDCLAFKLRDDFSSRICNIAALKVKFWFLKHDFPSSIYNCNLRALDLFHPHIAVILILQLEKATCSVHKYPKW